MEFDKYLPKYLIVKNVLTLDSITTHHYFLTRASEVNAKFLKHENIVSWHPLIVKDGKNFYYFKGLKETDFLLANFCINNETFDAKYNSLILENYFNKNSFEI